jgi:transcriptional regulator with XRE-family HTH domain
MEPRIKYGEALRAFQELPDMNMSLRELARRVHLSAGYVSQIMTATCAPPAPCVRERFSEALAARWRECNGITTPAVEVNGRGIHLDELASLGAWQRCRCLTCSERAYCTWSGSLNHYEGRG